MLGSLLLGLAIGSVIARRLTKPPELAHNWVGASMALAGLFVLLTLGLWDEIPAVFLLFAQSSPSFALMEAVRFAVASLLILITSETAAGIGARTSITYRRFFPSSNRAPKTSSKSAPATTVP